MNYLLQNLFYISGIYDTPAGFDAINPDLGSAYMFTTIKKSWAEARDFCIEKNSHLLAIETAEENDYLINTAIKQIWGIILYHLFHSKVSGLLILI